MALKGTLTHRKTRRLSRVLGVPPCYALGVLEALWHVTAEQFPDGALTGLSNQDIADEMFFDGDADQLIEALVTSGFLDRSDAGIQVHGWSERADNGIHASLAKKTLLFADGTLPKIPHEWFSAASRERIKAEYSQKYPDLVQESPGQIPDKSRTSPGQIPDKSPPSHLANKPSCINQSASTTQSANTSKDKNTSKHASAEKLKKGGTPANPTLEECREYALASFNLNGSFAQRFFEVNSERGWLDGNGKPYQNWKNLMRVWVAKEKNLGQYRPDAEPERNLSVDEIGREHGWGDDE